MQSINYLIILLNFLHLSSCFPTNEEIKFSTNESSVTKESVIITTIGTSLHNSSTASLVHDNSSNITTIESTIETVKLENTTEPSSAFKSTDDSLNTSKIATVNCNNNGIKTLDEKPEESEKKTKTSEEPMKTEKTTSDKTLSTFKISSKSENFTTTTTFQKSNSTKESQNFMKSKMSMTEHEDSSEIIENLQNQLKDLRFLFFITTSSLSVIIIVAIGIIIAISLFCKKNTIVKVNGKVPTDEEIKVIMDEFDGKRVEEKKVETEVCDGFEFDEEY